MTYAARIARFFRLASDADLDSIPGIGPERLKKIKALRAAGDRDLMDETDDLIRVRGIGEATQENAEEGIHAFLSEWERVNGFEDEGEPEA